MSARVLGYEGQTAASWDVDQSVGRAGFLWVGAWGSQFLFPAVVLRLRFRVSTSLSKRSFP